MSRIFDVGDEVVTRDQLKTGVVMDHITDRTVMVLFDDEAFCRMLHTDTLTRPDYATVIRNPEQRRTFLGAACWVVAAALLITAVMWMVSGSSKAEPVTSSAPYGGCKEVVQDPPRITGTEGAAWCRAHGWTIRPRLVVGPRGVVWYHRLPSCTYEDGSGLPLPCSWNIRAGDGNGIGLAYWIDRHHHGHYVWPIDPVRSNVGPPLHWVSSALADALVEGDQPHRRWEKCVVQYGKTTLVICPDGYRERS